VCVTTKMIPLINRTTLHANRVVEPVRKFHGGSDMSIKLQSKTSLYMYNKSENLRLLYKLRDTYLQ